MAGEAKGTESPAHPPHEVLTAGIDQLRGGFCARVYLQPRLLLVLRQGFRHALLARLRLRYRLQRLFGQHVHVLRLMCQVVKLHAMGAVLMYVNALQHDDEYGTRCQALSGSITAAQ